MTEQNQDEHDESKSLNSSDYQHRLLNKLNCLIAVLEVAIGKITQSIDKDEDKAERLGKIKTNLENTLSICRRAKKTLETKIAQGLTATQTIDAQDDPEHPTSTPRTPRQLGFRSYVELSSIDEFRKFKKMGPISENDLTDVDLDDLAKKLGDI